MGREASITINMDKELKAVLRNLAAKEERSESQYCRRIIEAALATHPTMSIAEDRPTWGHAGGPSAIPPDGKRRRGRTNAEGSGQMDAG